MDKLDIEVRIKEIDAVILQQSQLNQQINNNILMLHGAKQELDMWLKKICDKEAAEKKAEEERLAAANQPAA